MKKVLPLFLMILFFSGSVFLFGQKSFHRDAKSLSFSKRMLDKYPPAVSEKQFLEMVLKYDMKDEFFESNGQVREDCRDLLIMSKEHLSKYVDNYYNEIYSFNFQFKSLKEEMVCYTSIAQFFKEVEKKYPKVDEHFKDHLDYVLWKNGMLEWDDHMFLGIENKTGAIMFLNDVDYEACSKDPGYIVFYKPGSLGQE